MIKNAFKERLWPFQCDKNGAQRRPEMNLLGKGKEERENKTGYQEQLGAVVFLWQKLNYVLKRAL